MFSIYKKKAITRVLVAAAALIATSVSGLAADMNVEIRVQLQTAMVDHIDYNSVDGRFVYYDDESGDILRLHPANLHPKIIVAGEYYVLCTDFLTEAGQRLDVDFLARRTDGEYRIFQTLANGHKQLSIAGRKSN